MFWPNVSPHGVEGEHETHLGISLDLEPAATQVTFAPKRVDRGRIVVANLLLLRVIADAHTDVVVTCPTT